MRSNSLSRAPMNDDPDRAVADRDRTGLCSSRYSRCPARPREHPREIRPSALVGADEPGAARVGGEHRSREDIRRRLGGATSARRVPDRVPSPRRSPRQTDRHGCRPRRLRAADGGRRGSRADVDDRIDLVRRRVDADERVRRRLPATALAAVARESDRGYGERRCKKRRRAAAIAQRLRVRRAGGRRSPSASSAAAISAAQVA